MRASSKRSTLVRPARVTVAATGPLLDQVERLREAILRSKLSHPDPWRYTPKARRWGERAQQLVDAIAAGETAALRRAVDTLAAEVEGDRDFQEARRLF